MIKTTKNQTNHIICNLINYPLYSDDSDYLKFQFVYVCFDNFIRQEIIDFKQNWENGSNRKNKQYFEFLNQMTIIDADYIFNNGHDHTKGFDFIKVGSVSYLENRPDFSNVESYNIAGGITCYYEFFTIDAERIPDGNQATSIIYKSPRINYMKIQELINNYRIKSNYKSNTE